MKLIKNDKIEKMLSSYLRGKITRKELVVWGKGNSAGVEFEDDIAGAAFYALCSATIGFQSFKEGEFPYFIREHDLNEWFLSIKRQDFKSSVKEDIIYLRPHQMLNIKMEQYLAIDIAPNKISDRLGIEHIRGLDDLDYFQEFNFQIKKGTQFRLIRHLRSPEPNAFVFYSNEHYPLNAINEILNKIGLTISDSIWLNPKFRRLS